jgi:2-oxoisovalerate dehydrogenase E1 component
MEKLDRKETAGMATKLRSQDLAGLDRASLLKMHRLMATVRELEEIERRLRRQQRAFFQISSAGHEAIGAAASLVLKPGHDWFYPYYRDRALALGLGVTPTDMLLQAMGKAADPSTGGRQMPCHWGAPALHIVNQSSPTGTQYLQAVGTADAGAILAAETASEFASSTAGKVPAFKRDEIVYVSGGEGSTSSGEFYEALSAACLRRLPVLFVVQDNSYAISVPVEAQTPGGSISAFLRGFPGVVVEEVNGLDPIEVYRVLRRAVTHLRARTAGPVLVHAHVVRLYPHSDSDDDLAYRPRSEKDADAARDPLLSFEERLVQDGYASEHDLKVVHDAVRREVDKAVEDASSAADPDPRTATLYVVSPRTAVEAQAELSESAGASEDAALGDAAGITIVDAINRTLEVEMERDPRVVVFGEDVADISRTEYLDEVRGKGGVFKVTHGLQRRFGENRVFNTPIAEAGIVGRALGMAVRGLVPVAEIQFLDYIWPAMHQLRNEVSVLRWRSNNNFSAGLVLRVPIGGYLSGGGPYHSQCAESIFCHCPGLRVVAPSNARDAVGLLRTSMRCGDPVLFFEHKHLYRQSYARRPYPGDDHVAPLGKARVVRPGRDVTVVTFGALVEKSLRAAETLAAEGIETEVIDLRSLSPYDWETIRESVERTNRVVVAYEDNLTHGFGAEISARIVDELFSQLDAPVARVGALDVPVAYSPVLERATLPQVAHLVDAVRRVRRF